MKNHHAVTLGKKGGKIGGRSRSPAKIATARKNGAKGGRPKKEARTLERELTTLTIERDQLRAEVERLRSDRDCEKRLRKDADEFRENAIARAERAEAERDALAKDKARLDWLSVSDAWFDYPATGAFTPETMRAAIDAAMKGTT